MNRYLNILLVCISTLFLLSSCGSIGSKDTQPSWNTQKNSDSQNVSVLASELKKALENPLTKTIADRIYTDYSAGFITENFLRTALIYLNNERVFPSVFENYKKNMNTFGEKPSDSAGDYMAGYIFAYAGLSPSDCREYTSGFSGAYVGKRIIEGCIDITLLYSTLQNKNEKDIDALKTSGELKINENFFRSIARGKVDNCSSCSFIIGSVEREAAFSKQKDLQKADLKDKVAKINLKDFNVMPLKSKIGSTLTEREKFDLIYDNFLSYHAIYMGDSSICNSIKDTVIASACTKYINKESAQKKEYANYIEPYIIYSYLYEL